MMSKLGVGSRWISLIMKCITSVSYSIAINGCTSENFCPGRGLRQGDPLSPYLFLICTEGLSAALSKLQRNNGMQGAQASRYGPRVSHLFFADDSLLFAKAERRESERVKDVLMNYEKCSGQVINFEKSAILFSGNTSVGTKTEIQELFGVQETTNLEKYLGLPTMVGRNRKKSFRDIKNRMEARLHGWSKRSLSVGGKEVFLKAIIQAIPTYAMSCFLFPKSFCHELNMMISRFWWKCDKNKKGIHWLS